MPCCGVQSHVPYATCYWHRRLPPCPSAARPGFPAATRPGSPTATRRRSDALPNTAGSPKTTTNALVASRHESRPPHTSHPPAASLRRRWKNSAPAVGAAAPSADTARFSNSDAAAQRCTSEHRWEPQDDHERPRRLPPRIATTAHFPSPRRVAASPLEKLRARRGCSGPQRRHGQILQQRRGGAAMHFRTPLGAPRRPRTRPSPPATNRDHRTLPIPPPRRCVAVGKSRRRSWDIRSAAPFRLFKSPSARINLPSDAPRP